MFLPLFFAALFMIGSMGCALSLGTLLAGAAFLLLGGGLVVGALKMSKAWEEASTD